MILNPVVFREYDIRGVVDKDFDADFAHHLGKSFASFHFKKTKIKNPVIVLGHDARLSCGKIVDALSAGLKSSGVIVRHIGLVTSPMSYFTTFFYKDVSGAVMVTGSHNPPDYNGFKLSVGKSTIFGEDIQSLKKIMVDKDYITGPGKEERVNIFEDYVNRYRSEFKNLKNIPFVLDCGNGAAGCVVRKLYEACGLKPTILFEEPDGRFPNHHPDPTVEKYLTALIKKVKETKSIVGIGFDGDADRIGVVDEKGKMILGDELIALVSKYILKTQKRAKIVGDVKCSNRVYDYISKNGGEPIMWKSGHSLIKQKIKSENSPFGGELSGHIFFNDRNYGYDDALYAGLRLIEILSAENKTITELLSDLPTAFSTPELRIDTTEEKKISIVNKIKETYAKTLKPENINNLDGIRITFTDGWALARPSNTQPVIVLRFESSSEQGLKKIQNEIETIVNSLL